MRTTATIVLIVAPAALAIAAHVACTGDDPTLKDAAPDAGGNDSAVPAPDAGGNDSAVPTTGGSIKCSGGTASCAATSQVCCDETDGGGTCVAAGSCLPTDGQIRCDSKDDCPGQYCCGRVTAPPEVLNTACQAAPCGGDFTLCNEASRDCPLSGDHCEPFDPNYRPTGYQFCKGP